LLLFHYLKPYYIMKLDHLAKRWWIPAIGYALGGGFINNLMLAPLTGQPLVDWPSLLTALGIMLAISGARDYLTRNKGDGLPENVSDKGWKRMWIPITGWALFFGFFINCVLAPHIKIQPNDWTQLIATLTVMLGISGAREVGMLPQIDEADQKRQRKKQEKTKK